MRKLTRLMALLIVLGLIAAGCSNDKDKGKDASKGEDGSTKQELVYATNTDAPGLSPIDYNDSVGSDVTVQIYETLFFLDPVTSEAEPLLAKSYENPDENTWIIELNENIEFHDGTPFNAEAVKYTFDEIKNPERAAARASLLASVESIEVEDEYTVVIKTSEPYGPMLAALSHSNAAIVSPKADQEGDIGKNPVGTGPFKFSNWVEGDYIELVRNDNYWREPAKLEKVTYKVVPEMSTAISMLETGDVQLISNFPSEHKSRLESLDNVEVLIEEGGRVSYLGFNMEKEPFTDLALRQAIAYGTDQEAYVNQLNGLGIYDGSIVGPKIFGYNESDKDSVYPYDPEKAKQLIKDNGYEGLEVTLLLSDRANYMKMGEITQSQLNELGLKAKIETMEWGAFLDTAKGGDFDIVFLGWANSTLDGSELLYPNLHSDNIGSNNYVRYNNEEFDKLVNASLATVDQDERMDFISKANVLAIEEAPMIVMDHGMVTAAYDKSVEGLVVAPTQTWYLYNVSRK